MKIISAIQLFISFMYIFPIWALEEIPAPNLSSDISYFQPWETLEKHVENTQEIVKAARTLQQSMKSQSGVEGQHNIFLAGLGGTQEQVSNKQEQTPFKR